MKKKLHKFGYLLLLALHLIAVFVVPIVPWIITLIHPQWYMVVMAICIFTFIQLPIMLYAATKEHSIIDRLIEKIKDYN